ncbi:MAG: hypothetical protein ACYDAC_04900 [Candidatus Dormibacteria bacterium]
MIRLLRRGRDLAASMRRLSGDGRALAAAWVAVVAAVTFPAPFSGPFFGPDSQWLLGLDMAARAHLQEGTQIIWPYGVLGFLGEPMYFFAAQWALVSAATVAVHAGVLTCVAVLLRRWRTPAWVWVVGAIALLAANSFGGYVDREGLLLVGLLTAVAIDQPRGRRGAAWLAAALVVAVLESLVVTTGLVVAIVEVAVVTAVALAQRRWWLAAASGPALAVGVVVAWVLTGQSLSGLPPFARATSEILTWYPATLSLPPSPTWLVLGSGAVTILAVTSLALLSTGGPRLGRVLLACLPPVLVVFRDAFVRFDLPRIHIFMSLLLVVAIVALGGATARARGDGDGRLHRWRGAAAAAAGVLACGLLAWAATPMVPFSDVASNVRGLGHMARLVVDRHAQLAQASAARRYFAGEIPLSAATVDVLRGGSVEPMPWDIAAVYAYDLRWNPQPVMESSEAFSSYLDGVDAAHLSGPDRPDFVLLSTETIDSRYNPFDEPAVFRALLDGYEVALPPDGNQLVLRRRAQVVAEPGRTLDVSCGPLARTVTVPAAAGERVFADVRLEQSLAGRIQSTLFEPASVAITLQLSDGSQANFRLAPGSAGDGLLMSSFAPDMASLDALFEGRPTPAVTSLTLGSSGPGDYSPSVCVRFWSQPGP